MVKPERELGAWLFPGTPAAVPSSLPSSLPLTGLAPGLRPLLSPLFPQQVGASFSASLLYLPTKAVWSPLLCLDSSELFLLRSMLWQCRGVEQARDVQEDPDPPQRASRPRVLSPPLPGTLWGERVRGMARHPGPLGLEFVQCLPGSVWCSRGWWSNVRRPVYAYLLAHLKVSVSSIRTVRL